MVRRLLDAGHPVVGYNRDPAKARPLVEKGMKPASSPRTAAEAADVIFSNVTDTTALRAVALGTDGIIAGLRPDSVYIDMSAVSPAAIRELGRLAGERGAAMLDAPVSGSVSTLESGQLAIMVGGDPAVLERVRPYLSAIGPTITYIGELGQAMSMKIAVNLSLMVQMIAFSESVLLAEKAGIPRERAVQAILASVAASPMLKYRGPFVLEMPAQPWANIRLMQKDLQLALEMGRTSGVPLAATGLAHELFIAAGAIGLGDQDMAGVFNVLARLSGRPDSPNAPPPS